MCIFSHVGLPADEQSTELDLGADSTKPSQLVYFRPIEPACINFINWCVQSHTLNSLPADEQRPANRGLESGSTKPSKLVYCRLIELAPIY